MKDNITANNQLHFACIIGDSNGVIYALNAGADVNALDIHGQHAPLITATTCGNLTIVKILLEKGANTELSSEGYTPLLVACSAGYLDIAKELIKYGANIEAIDDEGNTPLLIATLEGQIEVVNYLLKKGVNRLATNNFNETAREIALKKGHTSLAVLFDNA
jgi:ankyrin repeat protein